MKHPQTLHTIRIYRLHAEGSENQEPSCIKGGHLIQVKSKPKINSEIKSGLEKKGRRAGCREMMLGEGGDGLMDEKIKGDDVARGRTHGRCKTDLRHPHPISDHRPSSATSPAGAFTTSFPKPVLTLPLPLIEWMPVDITVDKIH